MEAKASAVTPYAVSQNRPLTTKNIVMKKKLPFLLFIAGIFFLAACNSNSTGSTRTKDSVSAKDTVHSEYNNPATQGAQNGE